MTDRELLEAAARAAGYEPVRWTDDGTALLLYGVQEPWNPLDENPHSDCMGDALRLAVKLRLIVEAGANRTIVFHPGADESVTKPIEWYEGSDPYAATRRAIVRAAAEIWEKS